MQDEAIATTDSGDKASCMINVAKSREEEKGVGQTRKVKNDKIVWGIA